MLQAPEHILRKSDFKRLWLCRVLQFDMLRTICLKIV